VLKHTRIWRAWTGI